MPRLKHKRPTVDDARAFLARGHYTVEPKTAYVSPQERSDRINSLIEELEAKVKEHLPRSRRLELVVLKCHLILEFMLNQFIDLMAPTEGHIAGTRFTFKQKTDLVHMLGFPPDPIFFPSVDLLNATRNSVAHSLELDRTRIDELIRINAEDPAEIVNLTDSQRASALKSITKFMCHHLMGVIEAHHAILWPETLKEANNPSHHTAESRAGARLPASRSHGVKPQISNMNDLPSPASSLEAIRQAPGFWDRNSKRRLNTASNLCLRKQTNNRKIQEETEPIHGQARCSLHRTNLLALCTQQYVIPFRYWLFG